MSRFVKNFGNTSFVIDKRSNKESNAVKAKRYRLQLLNPNTPVKQRLMMKVWLKYKR